MKLGILDLIQPSFGMGLFIDNIPPAGLSVLPDSALSILNSVPSTIRDLLSVLSVEELHMAYDDQGIVYYGKVQYGGEGLVQNTPKIQTPSGHLIEPGDLGFQFRIAFPRSGSTSLSASVDNVFNSLNTSGKADFGDLRTMLNKLGGKGTAAADIPSDYPCKNFKIELLFNSIIIHFPTDKFLPARLAADGWLEPDPNFKEVTLNLPKIAMSITQNDDDYGKTKISFDGWGINSLDDETELSAGELISMTPGLCLSKGNTIGFGIEEIVMDFSKDFTPPEIIANNFGVGDDFTGFWIPKARFFLAPHGIKGMAFDTWGNDLLFDMDQGFSGEIGMELVNNVNRAPLEVDIIFFDLETKSPKIEGKDSVDGNNNVTRKSFILTSITAQIQLRIRGGKPPYSITVKRNGTTITPEPFNGDPNRLRYPLNAPSPDFYDISVHVEDSLTPTHRFWQENIEANCVDTNRPRDPAVQKPQIEQLTGTDMYKIVLPEKQTDKNAILIKTIPDNADVDAGGPISRGIDGTYSIPVKRNSIHVTVTATWPVTGAPEHFTLFDKTHPDQNNTGENVYVLPFVFDQPDNDTKADLLLTSFKNEENITGGIAAFINRRNGRHLNLYGYASYEQHPEQDGPNRNLSSRRLNILKSLISQADPSILPADITTDPRGSDDARINFPINGPEYRVAIAAYPTPLPPATPNTASAEVWRDPDKPSLSPTPDPAPVPQEPERPSSFRRIAARVRFQRWDLVFAEISGEFDVIDEAKRDGQLIQNADNRNSGDSSSITNAVKTAPGASANPENQGIIDYKISMLFDPATGKLTQTLSFGFDKSNAKDGFVSIGSFSPKPLANTMASLLLFAPLIQGGIEAVQSADTDENRTKAMAIAGAEIGVATVLGLFAVDMVKITLFGADFTVSEVSPDIWLWHAQKVTDIGVLLDYAVDFKVNFRLPGDLLVIQTKDDDPATGKRLLPPRARYKAIGFNFDKDPATGKIKYQPVFDTSKGYELSLGDPGALEVLALGHSLNNLLRILSARLSRENPMILETDLALNVNLGIICVDNVRITLRIQDDGSKSFEIIPTKVSVNIPGALTGTGYLDFGNDSGNGSVEGTSGGFQGYVDVTLVPVKLRIAASVGIKPVSENGRNATAVFLALEVDLPAAIPLGGSGLGIYGFLGLFAMHYQRLEQPQQDGQLPPALKWFYDPPIQGNVINIQGWGPKLDKWSFGLGVILGTMEGGFVLNMKGMFVLELPGPRILILVKVSLLFPKPPDVKQAGHDQSVGILAVVDLDFNLGLLTIGLILEYNIKSVLSLRVPIVSQFSFNDPQNWFIDLGNNIMPASATILGIVKGYAYLMVHGNGIQNWPKPGDPQKLFGFSIAFGLGASLVFGDKDSGLYLEVGGDLAAGIGFSPLHFYGILTLRGQLHLWIVSISAHADLEVEGPNPHTYIHGKACGKVSFFFFDVEGCVTIEINSPVDLQPPPDLLVSLTLVSRSSALIAGQGVDRPIDGALGKAAVSGVDDTSDAKLTVVPLDSIPVINLFATPDTQGCTTFTDPIGLSSTYTQDGWVSTSAKNFVRYRITSIQLNDTLLENDKPKPVRFWKKPTDNPTDEESSVDMALLAWSPDPTPRAVQRSKELTTTVTNQWETVCKQVAPATTVLYTFNQKPLGYSASGWNLSGIAWPDAPGTIRSKPADTSIYVYENRFPDNIPGLQEAWNIIRESVIDHAKVIGGSSSVGFNPSVIVAKLGRVLQLPFEAAAQRVNGQLNLPAETIDGIKSFEAENILIDSGELEAAEILLALSADIIQPKEVIIRTLDENFKVLKEETAVDYGFTPINSITDLPAQWKEPGPWVTDVNLVMTLLQSLARLKKQILILVHYKAEKSMRYLEIVTKRSKRSADGPSLLLCAMEMLTAAEFEREEHDSTSQQTDKDTLNDALQGEPLRALLKPNTRYELTVNYDFQRKDENGLIDDDFVAAPAKTFVFKTDAAAPLRMIPWIFASTPRNNMRYHFKDDPVQIYLNDESVIQLYKAYNITLLAKVLKSNGSHPVIPDPSKLKLDMINTNFVKKIPAAIKTPYLHTLEDVVSNNNIFPCINSSGESEEHVVFTIGVDLILNTEYTVEIVKDGEVIVPDSNTYRTPMYKLAFRTSRYNSASAFAAAISGTRSNTRLLTASLGLLDVECTDNQMETALMTAGLAGVKAADNIGVSFLWSSIDIGGNVTSKLEAILIDTPEPLWRKRPFPDEETVTSDSGDMIQWVMKDKPELELVEAADTAAVMQMSHTNGGARTIVYLKPGAAGTQLHLQMKKHLFSVSPADYDAAANVQLFEVMNIQLPAEAPWDIEE